MNRERLKQQLVLHEGLRLSSYTDTVGKITVGIGHNISDCGITVPLSVVDSLFDADLKKVERELDRYLPWWTEQDEIRQRVLVDLWFNMGGRVLGFKNFLVALRTQQYDAAADHLLDSKWATQVGSRSVRLTNMIRTGRDYTI